MSVRATVRRQSPEGQPIVWPAAGESPAAAAEQGARPSRAVGAPPHEENRVSERALAEARQAAFLEGESAGRGKALAETRPMLERLAHTVEELVKLRPRLREQAEEDLVRLAVAIARRVVRRELTIDPQAITGLVKAALGQLPAEEKVRLRVHPELEAAVRGYLEAAGRCAVDVVGDRALAPGSAVFETSRGNLDASAESQLAEIERGLTDRFRSAR